MLARSLSQSGPTPTDCGWICQKVTWRRRRRVEQRSVPPEKKRKKRKENTAHGRSVILLVVLLCPLTSFIYSIPSVITIDKHLQLPSVRQTRGNIAASSLPSPPRSMDVLIFIAATWQNVLPSSSPAKLAYHRPLETIERKLLFHYDSLFSESFKSCLVAIPGWHKRWCNWRPVF